MNKLFSVNIVLVGRFFIIGPAVLFFSAAASNRTRKFYRWKNNDKKITYSTIKHKTHSNTATGILKIYIYIL